MDGALLFLPIVLGFLSAHLLFISLEVIDAETTLVSFFGLLDLILINLISDRAMQVQLVTNVKILVVHRMDTMVAWEGDPIDVGQ